MEPLRLLYTNWRGKMSFRRVIPKSVAFKSTEFHPEPQWIMTAMDVDKNELRDFAMRDMQSNTDVIVASIKNIANTTEDAMTPEQIDKHRARTMHDKSCCSIDTHVPFEKLSPSARAYWLGIAKSVRENDITAARTALSEALDEIARLRLALEIIAGVRLCPDNLMGKYSENWR